MLVGVVVVAHLPPNAIYLLQQANSQRLLPPRRALPRLQALVAAKYSGVSMQITFSIIKFYYETIVCVLSS